MPERSDVIYLYDGSFDGLLCCIFESYEKKEIPLDIQPEYAVQMSLYSSRTIALDRAKARRVKEGIRRVSEDVYDFVTLGYYTCHPQKERLILDFVRIGMKYGANALHMLTDDTVNTLNNAVRKMEHEGHQLKGFVRFSIYDQVMIAVIEPKNYVLPMIAPHFCDRYQNETFMIYDENHREALLYRPRESIITEVHDFTLPEATENEMRYRSLWKLFYDTIAIEERYNPKCRMSHMQKRYWKHLTEMDESLVKKGSEEKQKEEIILLKEKIL